MSSKEFIEWCAYDRMDPAGEERADMRAAMISATIVNCNRSKRSKAAKIQDFMLKFKKRVMKAIPQDQLKMKLMAWKNIHNDNVNSGQKFIDKRGERHAVRKKKRESFALKESLRLKGNRKKLKG